MEGFWEGIYQNKALWAVVLSASVAQCLKIIRGIIVERRFNFYWLLGTGGMPSAHSAAVVSLVICVGKEVGSSSPFFALSIIFALITMFDAQTWRRSIGFQAKLLNKIMEDFQKGREVGEDRLKELVGHTPIEVFIGGLVGGIITFMFYW
ncbi:MAG: divergent PAP2 family protein [Candidatus Omnitrophica bacterium]|nr:divergent PAP2 family protein [Candidatus Omnitrophota bacterium]